MIDQIYPTVNKIFFFSKKKHCPVCGSDFFSFLPLPKAYEASWKKFGFPFSAKDFETLNIREFSCPKCFASDRERLYAIFLQKEILANKSIRSILDIAPSLSLSSFIKKKFDGIYHTADLFMPNVDFKVNIESTGFENDQYDLIICSHVLEHVPDDKKAMKEIYRILKPNGKVIAMVPIVPGLNEIRENKDEQEVSNRWRLFGQDDHIRLYSKSGFVERLKDAGFSIKQYKPSDFKIDTDKIGVDPKSVLYIASK